MALCGCYLTACHAFSVRSLLAHVYTFIAHRRVLNRVSLQSLRAMSVHYSLNVPTATLLKLLTYAKSLHDVLAALTAERKSPLKAITGCLPDNHQQKRPPEGRLQQTQPAFDWHRHDAAALGTAHCKGSIGLHEYVILHLHPVEQSLHNQAVSPVPCSTVEHSVHTIHVYILTASTGPFCQATYFPISGKNAASSAFGAAVVWVSLASPSKVVCMSHLCSFMCLACLHTHFCLS